MFRSLRLLHNRQLAVLVRPPPAPRGESIIAREPQCRRDRQCPESAYINIIPSGLCNSRQHPHYHVFTASIREGQKPAPTSFQASDYTIRIMLSTLRHQVAWVVPPTSRARRRQERAWLQWPGPSRPFASPAPGRGIGAPISPIPLPRCRSASASSIFYRQHPHQPQCDSGILPP